MPDDPNKSLEEDFKAHDRDREYDERDRYRVAEEEKYDEYLLDAKREQTYEDRFTEGGRFSKERE